MTPSGGGGVMGFLGLPAGYGDRARTVAVVVGWTQLAGMVVLLAVGQGLAALQRSLGDPNGVVTAIAGAVPVVLLGALGIVVFRARGVVVGDAVRGQALDLERARRVHTALAWLVVAVVVAGLAAALVGLVAVFANRSIDYLALDLVVLLVPLAAIAIGVIGYVGARYAVRPSPVDLARVAGRPWP